MNVAGLVSGRPHEYHEPFISWPSESATRQPNVFTVFAYWRR